MLDRVILGLPDIVCVPPAVRVPADKLAPEANVILLVVRADTVTVLPTVAPDATSVAIQKYPVDAADIACVKPVNVYVPAAPPVTALPMADAAENEFVEL